MLCRVEFYALDLIGDANRRDGCGDRLVGQAVDTDKGGDKLARSRIDDLGHTSEIARLFQIFLILRRELHVQVFVEVRLPTNRMRHERDRTVGILPQRQPRLHRDANATEIGCAFDKLRLAIVAHPFQIARLLQRCEVDAPALFDLRTVETVDVDRLVTLLGGLFFDGCRLLLRLLGRRCLFRRGGFLCLLLCGGLLILGRIDFVRRQHILETYGVFQQVFHYRHDFLHALRRDAVEPEAFRLLALAVEVGEEIIQRIAMTVETQKILRVFRLSGFQVRRAVVLQARDHPDLARLLVPDDQDILFFLFLFHTLLLLIGLHPLDALRI